MVNESEAGEDLVRHRYDRIEAVVSLVQTGGAEAAKVLAGALTYPGPYFQKMLAERLIEVGPTAIDALAIVGRDPDPKLRLAASSVLSRFRDNRIVEPLVHYLSDTDPQVRIATAGGLARIPDRRSLAPLTQMATGDLETTGRQAAENALYRIWAGLIAPQVKMLASDDMNQRRKARAALTAEGKPAVPALIDLLEHTEPQVRRAGAEILGAIVDPRAIEPLLRAMVDSNEDVRSAARAALTALKSEKVARQLVAGLSNPDRRLVDEFSVALAEQGSVAVAPLIELLGSGDLGLQTEAVETLSRLRDFRATQPLIACLNVPDSYLRSATARALGRLGDQSACEALCSRLKDPVPLVRTAAAEALGELVVTDAGSALIAALRDEESIVRIAAAHALGRLGGNLAGDHLVRLITLPEIEHPVRIAGIEALAEMGEPRAIPVLKRMIRPWPFSSEPAEIRDAARKALARLEPRFANR